MVKHWWNFLWGLHPKDLAHSKIKKFYSLQIDNQIQQCVNSNWTGILKNKFVMHGHYIRLTTPLLISVFHKWQCCYANRSHSVQEWRVSWTGILKNKFVVHDRYIRIATLLLISVFHKWQSCYVNRSHSVQEWRVVIM